MEHVFKEHTIQRLVLAHARAKLTAPGSQRSMLQQLKYRLILFHSVNIQTCKESKHDINRLSFVTIWDNFYLRRTLGTPLLFASLQT